MHQRSLWRAAALLAVSAGLVTACDSSTPAAPLQKVNGPSYDVTTTSSVFGSGISPVTAWDPIFPAAAIANYPATVCISQPAVGLNANWQNPHPAFVFPLGSHPWETLPLGDFPANWINSWNFLNSQGPGGMSWTKYSTTVQGQGQFVVQFLADNCSWIYLDNQLVGVQDNDWSHDGTGKYLVNLNGTPQTLTFIIFDGGGLAGGKFRLETTQSFEDNGGDLGQVKPPADATPPVIVPHIAGTMGNNGWYTSDVDLTWSVTDPESAVSSSTGCDETSLTTDTNGETYTCTASSTGGTDHQSVTIARDATPPSVGFSGNAGSYTVDQSVAITCSASDATSGLATSTCPNASGDAYSFGLGSHQLTASAADMAGNTSGATASFDVTVTAGSLCTLVNRWVNKAGVANSMCQELNNGAYGAFRNHVSAQSGKSVSAAHADILKALSLSL